MTMEQLFEFVPQELHEDFNNLLHEEEVSSEFWERVKVDKKMQQVVIFVLGALADATDPLYRPQLATVSKR